MAVMLDHLVMDNEVLKQFKDLTAKEEKLFYYAFGKLQSKALGIKTSLYDINYESSMEDIGILDELQVSIDYEEIKILNNVNRVDRSNFRVLEKQLISNASYITLWDQINEEYQVISLYEKIIFNNKEKKVEVLFTESALELLVRIDKFAGNAEIEIRDLCQIEKSGDLKLFLYALTILRKNKGMIRISFDKVREILNPKTTIEDKMFYKRYIKDPVDRINKLNLSIKINTLRDNGNIVFSIHKV